MRRIPLSLEIFPRIYIYIYTSDERGSCTATCRINNDQSIRSRRLTGSSGRDRRGGGEEEGSGTWIRRVGDRQGLCKHSDRMEITGFRRKWEKVGRFENLHRIDGGNGITGWKNGRKCVNRGACARSITLCNNIAQIYNSKRGGLNGKFLSILFSNHFVSGSKESLKTSIVDLQRLRRL